MKESGVRGSSRSSGRVLVASVRNVTSDEVRRLRHAEQIKELISFFKIGKSEEITEQHGFHNKKIKSVDMIMILLINKYNYFCQAVSLKE